MSTIFILTHVNKNDSLYCSYVHSHAKNLVKLKNKVIVLAVNNYFPFLKKKRKKEIIFVDGVEIRYVNRLSFSNFLYNSKINLNGFLYYLIAKKELKKILKDHQIDLIDAHTYKVEGYAAYLLKKKFKIKTFVTLHGTSFNRNFNSKNGRLEIKKIGKVIDYYIPVSDKIKRQLNELGILNTKVIYNGINQYNLKRNNSNHKIISVGYLTKVKNYDVLIKAFKEVCVIFSDVTLTIVGDGNLKSELETLVQELKLQNVVKFLGNVDNKEVNKLLANSNIFVLPSKPEGFGIAYVEAMNNGCITIGTKGEGIDGFIKDKENGFLVNVSEKEISTLLIEILNSKYDLAKIQKNALKDASKLTWEENALAYQRLLKEKK